MIPIRPALREAIDQRNRDYMLTERIRALIAEFLAPSEGTVGAGIPVSVPPPLRWRPEAPPSVATTPALAVQVGEAGTRPPVADGRRFGRVRDWASDPATTSAADPTSRGRPGAGGTGSRPLTSG